MLGSKDPYISMELLKILNFLFWLDHTNTHSFAGRFIFSKLVINYVENKFWTSSLIGDLKSLTLKEPTNLGSVEILFLTFKSA